MNSFASNIDVSTLGAASEALVQVVMAPSTHAPLLAAGKPGKMALIACMRKQLPILNTVLKNGTHWNENLT